MPKSKITHYAGLGTKVNIVNVFNYESPTPEKEEDEHMEEYYGKVSKHERLSGINLPWKTQNIQERHTLKYHTI